MKIITLPCSSSDDLNWEKLLPSIDTPSLFWNFDFTIHFPLEDEFAFNSIRLALSHFAQKIFPLYQASTIGASLYNGPADFTPFFHWSEKQEENWITWKNERPHPTKKSFIADTFAIYFQMLSHALPDELPLYLLFDSEPHLTPAETLQLLSKERYEHFHLATNNLPGWDGPFWNQNSFSDPSTYPLAISLPEDKVITPSLLQKIDELLIQDPKIRVISELFLTERWEGVDTLYIFPDAVSPQGKRKLAGFRATGGEVVEI